RCCCCRHCVVACDHEAEDVPTTSLNQWRMSWTRPNTFPAATVSHLTCCCCCLNDHPPRSRLARIPFHCWDPTVSASDSTTRQPRWKLSSPSGRRRKWLPLQLHWMVAVLSMLALSFPFPSYSRLLPI